MTTHTFSLKSVNDEGTALESGICDGSGRLPSEASSGDTFYIKKPGQGVPFCFFVNPLGYDWIPYIGTPGVGNLVWDPAPVAYGYTGCYRSEPAYSGATIIVSDRPPASPTHVNFYTTIGGYESPDVYPVWKAYDTQGREVFSTTWGESTDFRIQWVDGIPDHIGSVKFITTDPKVLSFFCFRIAVKRET